MSSRRRPGAPCDIEELRPGLFIVHNPAAGPALRGEGERDGDRFRLTGWRREGLVARLRSRGFEVLTLADQIDALPALATAVPPGGFVSRPLAGGERVSYFSGRPLGWAPAPAAPDDAGSVELRVGWVIRRRKGRGPADYYRVAGPGALAPLDEDEALLAGYAQAALEAPAPLAVEPVPGGLLAPDLPLPTPHRNLLGRFAERAPEGWRVAPEALPLLADLLARLGLMLLQPGGARP